MLSYKRIFFIQVFSLMTLCLFSQTGAPLLTHYKDTREIENQNWAICQDENNVMMFASRRGIMTFDGQNRDFISLPTIPASLVFNKAQKRVYVGGVNTYGYLLRDEKGIYSYSPLYRDSSDIGLITRIIFTDSTVFFYGEQSISRHNLNTGKLEMRLSRKGDRPFTGMFNTSRNTFINVLSEGLYRLESDTLFPIVTGYLLRDREVLFSLPYDERQVLLGLSDGELTLFDGLKFYTYPVRDDGYLRENTLSDGLLVSDSLYAFSTLDGGALVVARTTGIVRKTINYQRGLPDDEIFAMGVDNNSGLWLSHQYGLTRAELILPVGNFNMYKGLMGNLINSVWHDNQLYVATSEGVFYLAQVRSFVNEEILVKKEPLFGKPAEIKPLTISPEQLKRPQEQEVQKTRKSVFSRIFGKRTTAVTDQDVRKDKETAVQTAEPGVSSAPPEPQYVRKTVSRLKSVNYEYFKVEGLNEKCKQLVSTPYGILVSTNRGLYVIRNHSARPIVKDRYIYSISRKSAGNKYYVAASDGYFYVSASAGEWSTGYPDKGYTQPVYSVVASGDNTLWAGSDDEVIRIIPGDVPSYASYRIKGDDPRRYITYYDNDTLFVLSSSGVSYYDRPSDSLKLYRSGLISEKDRLEYVMSQPEALWIKAGDEWICMEAGGKIKAGDRAILKIFDDIVSVVHDDRYLWIITGQNQIYRIAINAISSMKSDLSLFIRSIRTDEGFNFNFSDIVIAPYDDLVYLDIVAPGYFKENSVQYQWKVEKLMDDWSPWQFSSVIPVPMQYGSYTISVRARDLWGNLSEIKSIPFTRKAPFTQTTLFYSLVLLVIFLLVILIVWFRESQLKREKHILEEKVKERTAEIAAQKEEITSSIAYASRIQLAMLPETEVFARFFPEHFIMFKPRDIVSGDFFWIGEDEKHIFFTVADCTGHGVPGAFMSTLGISTLYEIITNNRSLHANTVLNLLRGKIKTSLHQTGKEGEATDGMDLSMCMLNKDRTVLEYSGAFNPLIIIQDGEVKEYKADRMPIGIYLSERDSFTNHKISVSPGDTVYLFSDGLTDQFGGPDGSKYKRATLKKLLSGIYERPLEEQKLIIENEFEKWKGNLNQIDDVTIIGLRI